MKLTKTSGASIAMTAAALIVSGAALIATANAEARSLRVASIQMNIGQRTSLAETERPSATPGGHTRSR